MTREEFKRRWEKDDNADGITYEEIADCAEQWGLYSNARIHDINEVTRRVLQEAQTNDCAEW